MMLMRVSGAYAVAVATLAGAAVSVGAQQTPPIPIEQRVDDVIGRQMSARRIPGLSLGVVRDGQLVLAKGYGDATLEWKQPATPDTNYLLASVTKQFTATAIMMLVGDGKIALDDAIGKYVDGGPASWAGITIRHLLTHTAGLRDRFEVSADGRMYLDYSTRQMLDAAARVPVDAAPGSKWQYSDQGYFLLGLVVERAAGKSYGEVLRERIFAPAGMTATGLHQWSAILPQRADGYALFGDRLIASRRRYQFELVPHYGVQSTVRDLAKYDAALSAGTLLPASMLEQMWTPARLGDGQPAEIAGIGYGFGWFLERFRGHREVHHGGSTGTCLYRFPDDKLSVIVLTNLEQVSGSAPCAIARMVGAMYLPAVAVAAVPPIEDTNPARAKRLRAAIEAFTRGAPDPADYAPASFAALAAAAKAQQRAFAALGTLTSFELIADDELVAPVVWYRGRYDKANTAVQYRFVLDRAGRITSLQAR